jgi:hypothetical protein
MKNNNDKSIEDEGYYVWTDNILDVDSYYELEKITLEITFKNNEIIECAVDEIGSQSKLKEKMEEKLQVTLPVLDEGDYGMFVYNIMRFAFCK